MGCAPKTSRIEGAFLADAGEHVQKRPAFRDMQAHIVDGEEGKGRALRQPGKASQAPRLVSTVVGSHSKIITYIKNIF